LALAGDDDECPHANKKKDDNGVVVQLDDLQSSTTNNDGKMQTGVISTNV
jgi:hypothetical protein